MSSKISLSIISLLISFVSYGQSLTDFLKVIQQDSLPICVPYSHEEQVYFGAIYRTDTIEGEAQDVFEKNDNYQKDSALLLTKEFVKQHLLPNTKFIFALNSKHIDSLDKEPIGDYLNSDFYAISSLISTKSFYLVLYERVFAKGGISSSEKFVCTFTKNGNFISRTLIASFVFGGTGFSVSGARVPWFADESGCINKDMSIKFTSQTRGVKKYKIQADGKIVETK
ncbi:MAG: hypothetical protein IPP32_13665 [Bacteroidetes bacterium]|nr:hypothetical protein [Bacteroidota bacterium]